MAAKKKPRTTEDKSPVDISTLGEQIDKYRSTPRGSQVVTPGGMPAASASTPSTPRPFTPVRPSSKPKTTPSRSSSTPQTPTPQATTTRPSGTPSVGPMGSVTRPTSTPTPSSGKRPTNPKKGERWTGPKGATYEWNGSKWNRVKDVDTTSAQWQSIIQEEFGSLWDVYNDNPDVKKVIDQSVKEGWYNDEDKMMAALGNTTWFRNTQASARQFAIQQSTDPASMDARITASVEDIRSQSLNLGVTFDEPTLRKIATDSIKFNYTDQQLFNAIGSESVALANTGGAAGREDLLRGATARDLRKTAAAYGQRPDDTMIETWTKELMLGSKSAAQWEESMRGQAYTQFRSLRDSLDRGETVESAMSAYKQQANRVLEGLVDVDQIDWTDDKWNKALNFKDEKTNEYRQMDIYEWNKYLRTLPEWQETDNAKSTYRNVAMSLAKGFGKMA